MTDTALKQQHHSHRSKNLSDLIPLNKKISRWHEWRGLIGSAVVPQ